MKSKIGLVLASLTASCVAATISVESLQTFDGIGDTGFAIKGPGGTLVPVQPNQGIARVGFFSSLTDAQVTNLVSTIDSNTFNDLLSGFTSLATDDFTNVATGYLGDILGFVSLSRDNYAPTGVFSLYTLTNSGTAWALFRHAEQMTPDPAPPALPITYGLSLNNGTILVGETGTYNTSLAIIDPTLTNVPVNAIVLIPEPSAALLGALGALGLLRRRRN